MRAGLARPFSVFSNQEGPTTTADSVIPAFLRLGTLARTKMTGIRELRVPISGIWRLGFKNDDAYEFRV